jgi:colanic acid biosynthesis glycosyl transferase WcaI
VALYHGNMGSKQGLELLLDAACLLKSRPEIQFVLCGEGPKKNDLVKYAQCLPNVRFLDLQLEDKLNELVNMADVHLLPQLANAADLVMPSKLTTMLASGIPVIAGANPGTQISQILYKIGMPIPPENATALAEALEKLFENPSLRHKLGNLGRSYACQYLDKEIILSKLHTLLTHLTSTLTPKKWSSPARVNARTPSRAASVAPTQQEENW